MGCCRFWLEAEEVRVGDVVGSGGGGVVADRDGEEVERPADGGAVDFALGHLAVAGDGMLVRATLGPLAMVMAASMSWALERGAGGAIS